MRLPAEMLQHILPGSAPQFGRLLGREQKQVECLHELWRRGGSHNTELETGTNGIGARGHRDHGFLHRHGLQDLVLDAARHPQGRHHRRRVLQIAAHIGHRARDHHLWPRQGLDLRRGIAPHDVEAQLRPALHQLGQHLLDEPAHPVDVGPVVHRPGEHHRHLVCRERRHAANLRTEVLGVDPIADRLNAAGHLGRQRLEQGRLVRRHEKGLPGLPGHLALVRQQTGALTTVEPGQGPAMFRRVLRPLGRVHIDKVHQHRHLGQQGGGELRHDPREHHGGIQLVLGLHLTHPAMQARVAVVSFGERAARQQPTGAEQLRAAGVQLLDVQVGTQGLKCRHMRDIFRIVDECAQEHPVMPLQVAQQVVRAHLVALVGRVRHPVHQVQDVRHVSPDCAR